MSSIDHATRERILREYDDERKRQGVPWGHCFCGCGQQTQLAAESDFQRAAVKGYPLRFLQNHNRRHKNSRHLSIAEYRQWWTDNTDTPYGFCWCGCGTLTDTAKYTRLDQMHRAGEPLRYVPGHNSRSAPRQYIEMDCGYKTPCWLWQWSINIWGYGYVMDSGKARRAHRVFYERKHGPIPEGASLHHLCAPYGGPRHCVNPDHLTPVTHAMNMRLGKNTKLDWGKVNAIRKLYSTGKYTKAALARSHNVSEHAIFQVVNYKTWRDV